MALQIRRGTDAERLLITPLQGELIYTTDTKKLYIGDGTTAGGVAVDTGTGGAGAANLNELTDVIVTSPTTGQVLKFNGTNWVNAADDAGTTGAVLLDELNDVIITSPTTGQVLKFNGTNWINAVDDAGGGASAVTSVNTQTGDVILTTLDVTEDTNLYFTSDRAADAAAGIFLSGTHSGVSFTYDSLTKNIDASLVTPVVSDLTGNVTGSVYAGDTSLLIDSTTKDAQLNIVNAVSVNANSLNLSSGATLSKFGSSGNVVFDRANGTSGSPTALVAGDTINTLLARAYNGTTYENSTRISSLRKGAGAASAIEVGVTDAAGSLFTILDISGDADRIGAFRPINIFDETYRPTAPSFSVWQFHDQVDANNFNFNRGRGTLATTTAVLPGDDIIDISFLGYNGTAMASAASISVTVDGTVTTGVPGRFIFRTSNGTSSVERLTIDKDGIVTVTGELLCTGVNGFGYSTGAGGTVTQLTSKSTGVTINKPTGEITTDAESLAADTAVSFVVSNTSVGPNDHVVISHVSGGSLGRYNVTATPGTDQFTVTIYNVTGSPLSEAITLKFTLIRSALV